MSSIKQVQDLEKQLAQARQQIHHLKERMREGAGPADADDKVSAAPSVPALRIVESSAKERRAAPPALEGFGEVRTNLRNYSRGIFKPPPPYRQFGPQTAYPHQKHNLPAKHIADRCLANYRGSVHVYAPHLHWPTFVQEYEELYRVGTFQHSRQPWVALFFAVLACGTLMEPRPPKPEDDADGSHFLDMCMMNFNTWSDELTIDHVRACLLISIYSVETNFRSSGWVWLGAAVRISQDIGLHLERRSYTSREVEMSMEAEMRRRVWWAVYNWDR